MLPVPKIDLIMFAEKFVCKLKSCKLKVNRGGGMSGKFVNLVRTRNWIENYSLDEIISLREARSKRDDVNLGVF